MSVRWTGSTANPKPSRVMSTSAASRSATWPSIVTTRRRSVGTTDSARRRAAASSASTKNVPIGSTPLGAAYGPGLGHRKSINFQTGGCGGPVTGSPERGPHALGEDGHLRVELGAVGGEELEDQVRSEEHTSEIQSRVDLVCS